MVCVVQFLHEQKGLSPKFKPQLHTNKQNNDPSGATSQNKGNFTQRPIKVNRTPRGTNSRVQTACL